MSKKIKKFLDVTVKSAEDGSGAFWFTASTEMRDRQGDVIVQNGWKTADFMKNPVILWAHNYYETPIGKALEMKMSPDSISAKIQFVPETIDPFAAKVEKLVAAGYLRTVSVGFMVYKSEPLTTEDLAQRPDMKYGQRLYGDLLEISVVPVPANPEALNENAYADVISRGFGLKQDEAVSKFLPYKNERGDVDARLLRASIAASWGARGGVKVTDADPTACRNHLYRVANQHDILVTNFEKTGQPDQKQLKSYFDDVWHEELLDVIHRADSDEEETIYKLIKGQKRQDLIAARDALNTVLTLSESGPRDPDEEEPEEDPENPQEPSDQTAALLGQTIKNLSDINARLH